MQHSKDLVPCGTCHFCSKSLDRKEAKFCSRSCNAKYSNKYRRTEVTRRTAAKAKAYSENPKLCLFCKSPMLLKQGQTVYNMMRNKFCNKSCAAKYHNYAGQTNTYRCKWCGRIINKWYCNNVCKEKYYIKINKPPKPKRKYLADFTKKEVYAKNKNYASARSTIQSHARATFVKHKSIDRCLL